MFDAKKKNGDKAINVYSKNGQYGISTFIKSVNGLNFDNGRRSRSIGGSIQEPITQIA